MSGKHQFKELHHGYETHLSAQQNCSQTPSWFSCAHGYGGWSQSDCIAPFKRPQTPLRLGCAFVVKTATSLTVTTLKRRADFLTAAALGSKCAKHSLVIQVRRRDDSEFSLSSIRIGFTATKRLGGAAIRNRAKRRLRAAAAQVLPEMGITGCDYVFIGREGTFKRCV